MWSRAVPADAAGRPGLVRAVVLAVLACAGAATGALGAGSCCAPERVASTSWPIAAGSEIVIDWQEVEWAGTDALGGVYALLWRPALGGGSEHLMALSHDDGLSWDPRSPLLVSPPGQVYSRAAVSADGQLIVVFSDGAQVSVIRSGDQGRSFSAALSLGPTEPYGAPRIAMADDGRTLVAWRHEAGDRLEVHAAVSPDHGRSWGPVRVLSATPPGGWLSRPQALVTTGAVVVAWTEEVDAPPEGLLDRAFTRTSIDDGALWYPPVRASVPDDTTGWVALDTTALNDLQALYAVRLGPTEVELRLNTSFNAGFTWAEQDEAVSPPLIDGGATLSSWPDGSTWVLWYERDDPAVEDIGAIVARRSPEHGRLGTWQPASRLAEGGFDQHGIRLSQGPAGVVDVVHGDYRELATCPHPPDVMLCESVYLDHGCDRGASWLPEELRLDLEGPPASPHSEEARVARSPGGRLHVFYTNNSSSAEGFEDQLVHVALDPRGPTPEFTVEARGPEGCSGSSHAFTLVSATVDWCLDPVHAWFVDDALVPGAEGERFELPPETEPGEHAVRFELSCGGTVNCRFRSETVSVLVQPGAESQVTGTAISGPLRLGKAALAGELTLSWRDDRPAAGGYNVMRGTLDSLHRDRVHDHLGEPCHLTRPPMADRLELTVASPPEDAYWLVAPADCAGEGHLGRDSFGALRPTEPLAVCGEMPD